MTTVFFLTMNGKNLIGFRKGSLVENYYLLRKRIFFIKKILKQILAYSEVVHRRPSGCSSCVERFSSVYNNLIVSIKAILISYM